MLEIAYEAPVENTDLAIESSDFIFAIAPHLENYPEYRDAVLASGKELWIDNGVHEKVRVTGHELADVVKKFRPAVIVAPDVVGDREETVRLTNDFLDEYGQLLEDYDVKSMVVVQGADEHERDLCFAQFLDRGIKVLGLGFRAFDRNDEKRWAFFQKIYRHEELERTRFHVLATASTKDIRRYRSFDRMSLDTSLPFQLAQKDLRLEDDNPLGPVDWDVPLTISQEVAVREYVQTIRRSIAGG